MYYNVKKRKKKNSALMRDLPEDSIWKTINEYDQCNKNNKCFNTYKPSKYINKHYTNHYYHTCD